MEMCFGNSRAWFPMAVSPLSWLGIPYLHGRASKSVISSWLDDGVCSRGPVDKGHELAAYVQYGKTL